VLAIAAAGVCVFDAVLLLLVATAGAGAMSIQNLIFQVTCDYWWSTPPLLLVCVCFRCIAAAAGCHRWCWCDVDPKSDFSSHF
jgi:hypothetical protein